MYGASLASGDATFPFQLAAVEDLSLVSEQASTPEMEGVLGADFLGQFSSFSLTDTSFTGVVGLTSGAGLDGAALNRAALNAALPPPFTVTYPVFKIGRSYYVLIDIIDGSGRRVRKLFLLDTGAEISALTTQEALNMGLLPLMIGPNPFQLLPALVPVQGVGGGAVGLITPVGVPGLGTFPFVIIDLPVNAPVVGVIGVDVLGGSLNLQLNGGVGTLTITTPLGQLVQFFIGLFRTILRAIGINARNLK